MKRLIEKGLMFGNLVEVSSPQLVERYNRALKHLTGKQTALKDFHIDISGYSPEIGDELQDDLYLNPNGCNRQFILLTTSQKSAPLLNMKFSTSRGILQQFIEKNESQLFALTARDAVAGELQNSVYEVSSPAKLLEIRQITVEADTIGGHVADADKLASLIDRFRSEQDGWRDDVLIAEMIELAKKTGDVTRVPISLPAMTFQQPSFWTSHFGGLYVFRGVKFPGVIASLPRDSLGVMPISPVMDIGQRNEIADWLERNGLVEPIVQARGMDAAGVLRQKMDFILVEAADALGLEIGDARRTELRKIAYRLGDSLPDEFLGLAALLRWVEGAGDWPRITSEHRAYFYTLRAAAGPDRDLVNMLLSELAPMDVRQMFIVHKELFYSHYAAWSDRKRKYVADFLEREYKVDAQGAREALFGPEPSMDVRAQSPKPTRDLVGPWGAVVGGRT
ncbi:MAG: hypothetical protein A3D16_15560 [Rhodobacterales bacterium RIFCSPHIGHO2_02_FULL_62_130]|nr:MAG: hypothetical protein A3E48_06480 [Rhodobacterales bacterium RIFCSPHIGHO2_12_FULL_62_75]OHC59716.1 MAG: hypothetical protein A3D16_15560 [Rhodobacterales bacterium RIFCSPHIGHO2_02_FULL_62_130]